MGAPRNHSTVSDGVTLPLLAHMRREGLFRLTQFWAWQLASRRDEDLAEGAGLG